jgi:MFS family permease
MVIDVGPIRTSHGFRWLYAGQVGANLARHVLVVTVPYQVFILTESSLYVGLAGLAQVVPLVMCSLIGGAVADAFDRRRVLVAVQVGMAVTSIGFAFNTGASAALWPIFVLIALNAGLAGVESPARTALIPSLVTPAQLPAAFALNATLSQTAQVVGPALAGLLIAQLSIAAAYWVAAVASLATALAMLPLGVRDAQRAGGRFSPGAIAEGWRYLRAAPLLQQVMLIDLNAMVFGMPRALFPEIGIQVLGGDATTVGLLHAAPGAGALAGALTTGWVSLIKRQGRVVVFGVCIWGLAIVGVGFTGNITVALALLAIAGAGDVVSNVFRNAILQMAVPDVLRGRLSAFKAALSGGGPHLGDAESGAVATFTTPATSVISGGLLTILGAVLITEWGRDLWDQRTDDLVEQTAIGDVTAGVGEVVR